MKINITLGEDNTLNYVFNYDTNSNELDILKIIVASLEKVGNRKYIPPVSEIKTTTRETTLDDVVDKFNNGVVRRKNKRLSKEEWTNVLTELDNGRVSMVELERQGFNRGTLNTMLSKFRRNNYKI